MTPPTPSAPSTPAPVRVGLMAAMPEELQAVLDAMPDESRVECGGRTFWVGHLAGREVVAVLSRIGKVAAATTTTLLISRFGVGEIIFTGVAGGLGDGVRVGDVVVADRLQQHDLDVSPLFPRYEMPGTGLDTLAPASARHQEVLQRTQACLSPQALSAGGPLADVHLHELGLSQPRVHAGKVISGDRFVSSAVESAALRQALPDALAVEMEGAVVAQVCHDFGVPFTVLRTISDRADDAAHVDFPRFIASVASRYAQVMVTACLQPPLPLA